MLPACIYQSHDPAWTGDTLNGPLVCVCVNCELCVCVCVCEPCLFGKAKRVLRNM